LIKPQIIHAITYLTGATLFPTFVGTTSMRTSIGALLIAWHTWLITPTWATTTKKEIIAAIY
jgi:hypothetical protein